MRKRIAFTGGGSAGHVMVNLACIPHFLEEGWEVAYLGQENGIERDLLTDFPSVRYEAISAGKLRRYFDWKNATDPFRIGKGVWQAYRFFRTWRPDVIFSKGGFVSVPAVMGGWLNGIPVVIHESDLTPGLANRLAIPFAQIVCTTFPDTLRHLPKGKGIHLGAIVREELKRGKKERGYALCGFRPQKPVLFVAGGSLGSARINQAIRNNLEELLAHFQIVHLCGSGQVDERLEQPGYKQFAYVNEELPDLLAITDVVVSRAGSNAIFEYLALQKPMLLIPLSKEASRGDQILNARSFEQQRLCHVLMEEELDDFSFRQAVDNLWHQRTDMLNSMRKMEQRDVLAELLHLIKTARR